MGEFRTWLIGVVGSGSGLALFFLWNLSRASYRIEREAHQTTRAELVSALEKSRLPVDWSVWRSRDRFTLLEAAHILAGTEPTTATARGHVAARLQEIKWAVEDERLETDLSPMARAQARADAFLGGRREIDDGVCIAREQFISYLRGRNDQAAWVALANLGATAQAQ